jgi:hypothetical protein
MGILNVKMIVMGLTVILWGWWIQQCFIPVAFPQLVNTPVAGLVSVLSSIILWVILALLFLKHDRSIRSSVKP